MKLNNQSEENCVSFPISYHKIPQIDIFQAISFDFLDHFSYQCIKFVAHAIQKRIGSITDFYGQIC